MALACIIAPIERDYYIDGEYSHSVQEVKQLHKRIYDNIRYIAYNLMGDVERTLKIKVIGYRTDGIMVFPKDVEKVVEYFNSNNFECSQNNIYKKDNYSYQYENGKEKRF